MVAINRKGGRGALPLAVKKLTQPGRGKVSDFPVPEPDTIRLPCPLELEGSAREEWMRISRELAALDLLAKVDRSALTGYCVAWGQFIDSTVMLQKPWNEGGGMIIRDAKGIPRVSPWFSVNQAASKDMRAFLTEFGM